MLKYLPFIMLALLAGCTQSLYQQGRDMVDEGRYQEAEALFYASIDKNPPGGKAWRELGVALYHQGDLTRSEDALMQANAIKPDPRVNLYLGLIYEKQDDYGQAIDAYRNALSLDPGGKTREMIETRLDGLMIKKIEKEVSSALADESAIDIDTIPENTIAVVDFDNSHLPPELAPISKGLAEFTALDLSRIKSLRVVDRMKIDVILDELKLGSSELADRSTAPRMGRLLGSNHIVTGSMIGIGDDVIKIDGAVINTRDSSTEMTGAAEGQLDKFFALQKDLVFKIVDNLGIQLTAAERDSIRQIPTESFLAFMAYCRGLEFRRQGMYDAAQSQFQQAVESDAGFDEAAVQHKAMVNIPEGSGDLPQFEAGLTGASEAEMEDAQIGQFQSGAISRNGFILDPNNMNDFGNTPDSPIRTIDVSGVGTIIIRGNLDAQP